MEFDGEIWGSFGLESHTHLGKGVYEIRKKRGTEKK
jgi:hypothetical protein